MHEPNSITRKPRVSFNFLGLPTLAPFSFRRGFKLSALVSHCACDNLLHANRLSSRAARCLIISQLPIRWRKRRSESSCTPRGRTSRGCTSRWFRARWELQWLRDAKAARNWDSLSGWCSWSWCRRRQRHSRGSGRVAKNKRSTQCARGLRGGRSRKSGFLNRILGKAETGTGRAGKNGRESF